MDMLFGDIYLLYIRQAIIMIGVVVICAGAARSLGQLFQVINGKKFDPNYIRLQFGNSVILGLEFMVGADIVGSLVAPDYYNLGLLAIVVVIRTILSYFLNLELKGLTPKEQRSLK